MIRFTNRPIKFDFKIRFDPWYKLIMIFWFLILSSLIISALYASVLNVNDGDKVLMTKSKLEEYSPSIGLNDLSGDILLYISEYFPSSVVKIGHINSHCFKIFHEEINLKHLVIKRFDTPEFENVDKDEPELVGILELAWCSHDQFILFRCLMEDITSEKGKPFRNLFRPIVLYLIRIFSKLTNDQKSNYTSSLSDRSTFEHKLASICANKGHLDLAFDLIKDDPIYVKKYFSSIENRPAVMTFFKENPQLAIQYGQACLLRGDEDYIEKYVLRFAYKWVAECLIYDAPKEFYAELLHLKPFILRYLEKDLFHSHDIPESEYSRIHLQFRKLLHDYFLPEIDQYKDYKRDFSYFNLINDLRFGETKLLDYVIDDVDVMFNLSYAALIANKTDHINKKTLDIRVFDEFGKIKNLNQKMTCFKIFFELMASKVEIFSQPYYYTNLLFNFYALKTIKPINSEVYFVFVAPKNLLFLGFPKLLSIGISSNNYLALNIINNVLNCTKIVNEDTEDIFDLKTCLNRNEQYTLSFEVFEYISKTPRLIEKFIFENRKFKINPKEFEDYTKYFNVPNLEMMSKIITLSKYYPSKLKSSKQLMAFEEMTGKSIVDIVLSEPISDYFKWRVVFAYWIKGDQKERIRDIKAVEILNLLKLEFPIEMNEIIK